MESVYVYTNGVTEQSTISDSFLYGLAYYMGFLYFYYLESDIKLFMWYSFLPVPFIFKIWIKIFTTKDYSQKNLLMHENYFRYFIWYLEVHIYNNLGKRFCRRTYRDDLGW